MFIVDSASNITALAKSLQSEPAFLNITYAPGGDVRSVTVFHDGTSLRKRDTNSLVITPLLTLPSLGELRIKGVVGQESRSWCC